MSAHEGRTRAVSPPISSLFSPFFFEMAPHYGSPGTDQMLAIACTVIGVGPGGNTSMVA